MHHIEPHFLWQHLYAAADDKNSPFFGREYSEFEYSQAIYNHYIHPQWDDIGSPTLFIKLLFADYNEGFAIIEMFGEWNDCIHNDIMYLKRDVADQLILHGINKFILIGDNILNFHASDDCYYEEWFEDLEDGWIAAVNFRDHVLREFNSVNIDYYINLGGELEELNWRTYSPLQLYQQVESLIRKRIG